MFRFLTAGESHGPALTAIIEGLPAGIPFDRARINQELGLRQKGFGRSARMLIEKDSVQILSGIKNGKTLGSPVTFLIQNQDQKPLDILPRLENPRPGHADLVGTLKFKHDDIRNTLERASARETAIRTAVGSLCQQFLNHFGVEFLSDVVSIGSFTTSQKTEDQINHYIKRYQKKGETLGGIFEVRIQGLPVGLGSFTQWDLRLNARLSYAVMSIPAIKGVEIGKGFELSKRKGSVAQDAIFYDGRHKKNFGYFRKTNLSGGIEGGISTGEEVIIRASMKPLSSVPRKTKNTVNVFTQKKSKPISPRTDTCAVWAASVVAKNVCAIEITKAFLEKFGGDSLDEVKTNYENFYRSI